MREVWKDVKGYEGLYMVSDTGKLWNCKRKIIMKTSKDRNGYLKTVLTKRGDRKNVSIHRLIASAFILNEENKPYVNHIDEVKTNNHYKNLEWCTPTENYYHGTNPKRIKQTQLTSVRYINHNKKMAKIYSKPLVAVHTKTNETLYFESGKHAERQGFHSGCIRACVNGKRKTHKGYKWYKQSDFEQKENKQCI